MTSIRPITPCVWFDSQAEEAAQYYVEVFPHSRITNVMRYTDVGSEIHGQPEGKVMAVEFELDGQPFTALNGGPLFKLTEAVSFQVYCRTQDEVDFYWERLGEGGAPEAKQCGWLKDRFGLSWQVVPAVLLEMLNDPDPAKGKRVMAVMLQQEKMDIAALEQAYRG
jgi:predicted 3-demethylubiquinone-9 3-methyltransferase (glyoxalase superfamily)